jgi:hypothetical protein
VDDLTGQIVPISLCSAEDALARPVPPGSYPGQPEPEAPPELELYEPFPDRPAGSRRVVVLYARTPDGARHRVGTLDVDPDLWPAVEALSQEASVGWVTREELGIPGPFEQPK